MNQPSQKPYFLIPIHVALHYGRCFKKRKVQFRTTFPKIEGTDDEMSEALMEHCPIEYNVNDWQISGKGAW